MLNAINWFEIPVLAYDRAVRFYSEVLGVTLQPFEMNGAKMAFFPYDPKKGVGGSLTCGDGYEPSDKGSLVYLNGGDDLAVPLSRVEPAGGSVVMPKTSIGEHGFIAVFADSEGNRVALHSLS
jgi:predicted enzyme related to lactoylglutathione lyase